MCKSICGADCGNCQFREHCRGCEKTNGCPFGNECFVARYIKDNGIDAYEGLKHKLIGEINSLEVFDMAKINELYPLHGSFVNLEYTLPNGNTVKFLNDNDMYLCNQVESENGICFGIASNPNFILVCKYGDNGTNPEMVLFKKF